MMYAALQEIQRRLNQLTSYIPPPREADPPPRRILLVHCHPVFDSSFSAAIANTFEQSAVQAGHEVRRVNLYDHDSPTKCFRPNLSKKERLDYFSFLDNQDERKLEPIIKKHVDLLRWCDTLVLCYPTWWMNMPASMKGFFDRSMVAGFTWDFPSPTKSAASLGLVPGLTNIERLVGLTTYGAPQRLVLAAGDNGRRTIANAVRHTVCPDATVTWLGLYGCDSVSLEQRNEFLDQVEELAKRI